LRRLPDFLETLAKDARQTIREGYYNIEGSYARTDIGLKESILRCKKNPVIAEIKVASPSAGRIVHNIDPEATASIMQRGGAAGLSILTEPRHFMGKVGYFIAAGKSSLPRLMKDIVLDPIQIKAATKMGAEGILLIESLFRKGLANVTLEEMIDLAHSNGIEVLLETHTREEFENALQTEADLVGINNRNHSNLRTDIQVTKKILDACDPKDRIIVSESGINTRNDIRFLKECGARAFLAGSSIMKSKNPEEKLRELVEA